VSAVVEKESMREMIIRRDTGFQIIDSGRGHWGGLDSVGLVPVRICRSDRDTQGVLRAALGDDACPVPWDELVKSRRSWLEADERRLRLNIFKEG
jgi:hypothetical protein